MAPALSAVLAASLVPSALAASLRARPQAPQATPPKKSGCFCPSADDLQWDYRGAPGGWIGDQGWTLNTGGRVSTKGAFDLLGGYVEFEMDVSKTLIGVNTNLYGIFPIPTVSKGNFDVSNYCAGQVSENDLYCPEMDIVESNGPVAWATTWHTQAKLTGNDTTDPNSWGCDPHGCAAERLYKPPLPYSASCNAEPGVIDAARPITVRTEFGQMNASVKVTFSQRNASVVLEGNDFKNDAAWPPMGTDKAVFREAMQTRGMVIESSQWVGWVPLNETCPSFNPTGEGSIFSIKKLKLKGRLVAGWTSRIGSTATPRR